MHSEDAWNALRKNGFYPIKVNGVPIFLSRRASWMAHHTYAIMTTYENGLYKNHWFKLVKIDSLPKVVRDWLPPIRQEDGSVWKSPTEKS